MCSCQLSLQRKIGFISVHSHHDLAFQPSGPTITPSVCQCTRPSPVTRQSCHRSNTFIAATQSSHIINRIIIVEPLGAAATSWHSRVIFSHGYGICTVIELAMESHWVGVPFCAKLVVPLCCLVALWRLCPHFRTTRDCADRRLSL